MCGSVAYTTAVNPRAVVMPSSASVRRQRALGGAVGVALLLFALVYHFFPNLLHVTPRIGQHAPALSGASSPMGFEQRPQARSPQLDAGPPLALAPRRVIDAQEHGGAPAAAASVESPETPQMSALLGRASKALVANKLTGDANVQRCCLRRR